jgi:BlaI family transcriptional regulator, penicillinase repressor
VAVRRLGELEAAAMDALWDRESPVTVRDVLDMLAERQLAYTTVMTVMNNLFEKGMLTRSMVGRAWVYLPAMTRGEYTSQVMRDALLSTKDQSSALAHFVDAMTDEESAAVRDLLRRRSRKRR